MIRAISIEVDIDDESDYWQGDEYDLVLEIVCEAVESIRLDAVRDIRVIERAFRCTKLL